MKKLVIILVLISYGLLFWLFPYVLYIQKAQPGAVNLQTFIVQVHIWLGAFFTGIILVLKIASLVRELILKNKEQE